MPAVLATAILNELDDYFRCVNSRGAGQCTAKFFFAEMFRIVFPNLHWFFVLDFLR